MRSGRSKKAAGCTSLLAVIFAMVVHAAASHARSVPSAEEFPRADFVEAASQVFDKEHLAAFGASVGDIGAMLPAAVERETSVYHPAADDAIGQLIEARLLQPARRAKAARAANAGRGKSRHRVIAVAKPRRRAAEAERPRRKGGRQFVRIAAAAADTVRAEQQVEQKVALAAVLPPLPIRKPHPPAIAAKLLFGGARSAAPLKPRAVGYYSRGCLAGGQALPVDGPAWQVMRLSRNRNWGHPELIGLLEKLAREAKAKDGWPGLLVGDISQPRGGPMLTGHASHQVGLDADIWFTPMPDRRLSERERETLSAVSMISGPTSINREVFTDEHVLVVKRAASYPEVERILVHPAIKKAMCEASANDRAWLAKVRPYYGHHYHFHIRLACPKGVEGCRAQAPVDHNEDGCGKELDYWFKVMTRPPTPRPPGYKPPPPKPPLTLADLPAECRVVLKAGKGTQVRDEAELVRTSIEATKEIIDISGEKRDVELPAPAATQPAATGDDADKADGGDAAAASDSK